MSGERKYCTDCGWEKHHMFQGEFPRCTNPKYRQPKKYSYRESKWDRYPFCSHTNMNGICPEFIQKKTIGTDIITIIKNLFKGGDR